MSEDTARALGAKAPGELTIGGKKCRLRPLGIRELTEVQREGVKIYRRAYLDNLRDSLEFLPNGQADFQRKVEETAHWDAEDLPRKQVFDAATLQIVPALQQWLAANMGIAIHRLNHVPTYQKMVGAALDSEALTSEEFQKLTGELPVKVKTGWINWWVTGTPEGMLTMIWHSVKHDGITRDEVDTLVSDPSTMMIFAREVESLSVPAAKNG